MANLEDYYTTSQLLGIMKARVGHAISRERVRQLIAAGELVAIKPGHDWFIEKKSADRWLNEWIALN
jgi:hypothetical protein